MSEQTSELSLWIVILCNACVCVCVCVCVVYTCLGAVWYERKSNQFIDILLEKVNLLIMTPVEGTVVVCAHALSPTRVEVHIMVTMHKDSKHIDCAQDMRVSLPPSTSPTGRTAAQRCPHQPRGIEPFIRPHRRHQNRRGKHARAQRNRRHGLPPLASSSLSVTGVIRTRDDAAQCGKLDDLTGHVVASLQRRANKGG